MSKRKKKKIKRADEEKRRNISLKIALLLLLPVAVVIALYYSGTGHEKGLIESSFIPQHETFPEKGRLEFIDSAGGNILKEIDIEVALSRKEKETGLMFRKSMPEDQGMLFVFETGELRGMWMKNTFISLDILFINENHEIVAIYKSTEPLSTSPMYSYGEAVFVVEVVAGFCDKYGIKVGDRIKFTYH
jgi:uncharacterized membrane protein (UPF0127 family)